MNIRGGKLTVMVVQFAVLIYIGTAFMWRCANAAQPQGGPRDSLPPIIMNSTPDFYTTNFDGDRVFIGFDEYVVLKDQAKEFFVSPFMGKKPVLSVRGRGVQVEFKDTLMPNTTYSLNFGNSVRDNNEGNPLNGLRFVFSTGDEIDSMIVSGYTIDAYKQDTVSRTLIYFFDPSVDSLPQDSVMFKSKPISVARAENNGIFIAQNLKPVDYRIYALEDTNGNFEYEPGTDRIGFLDSTYNPVNLPDFRAWYDSTRMSMNADPQLLFRMFMDQPFKRQNLSQSARPIQHRIELMFGAPDPQIDSIVIFGIEQERIIREYVTQGRDTLNLWLNVPSDSLADTLRGFVSYMKHDSLRQLQPQIDSLRLIWRYIESKEEEKARLKEEKERQRAEEEGEEYTPPVIPNPFKHKLDISGSLNPEKPLTMTFDYPLTVVDTSAILLEWIGGEDRRLSLPFGFERDSVAIREWRLSADWKEGQDYELMIPAGTFHNVAGEINDTLKTKFSVMKAEDYGIFIVNFTAKSASGTYVLQLLDENSKILQEKPVTGNGKYTFNFVPPGNVKFRVIEDDNGNGRWDTGNLVERIQPERVELYYNESGEDILPVRANWEVSVDLDMHVMFAPFDINVLRTKIHRMEEVRLRRLEEERKKRLQNEQRNRNRSNTSASQSMQNAMGGLRQF